MAVMAETPTWLPQGRPFMVDDLDALPADGNRYELLATEILTSLCARLHGERAAASRAARAIEAAIGPGEAWP